MFDPRYRLSLSQAVFHDSVITTHHSTLDNLKFRDVKTTRALDFRWLEQDGWVQQTTFRDGSVLTANFSPHASNGIAAQTLRAHLTDGRKFDFRE